MYDTTFFMGFEYFYGKWSIIKTKYAFACYNEKMKK